MNFGNISSVQFSCLVVSNSLWPHGLQHTSLLCPSPTPGACSKSCPSSQECHPAISSSFIPFFSCLHSFPKSGSFLLSQFYPSGDQSIRFQLQHQSFQWIFRTDFLWDWLDWSPCNPRDSQESFQHHSSKASVLQHSRFFMVQLSHPYMTIGKTIALSIWTLLVK